jgi:hypothetical protein
MPKDPADIFDKHPHLLDDIAEVIGDIPPDEQEDFFAFVEACASLMTNQDSENAVMQWVDNFAAMTPEERLQMLRIIGSETEDVIADMQAYITERPTRLKGVAGVARKDFN